MPSTTGSSEIGFPFAGFTEAAADHPPSQHQCSRFPMAAAGVDEKMAVCCSDCYTIWYTTRTIKASDVAVFQEAERRYGGNPKVVTSTSAHHPLFDVYLVPAGMRRCMQCSRVLEIKEFIGNAVTDRNRHKCITCNSKLAAPHLILTEAESDRIAAKARETQPKSWNNRPIVFGRTKTRRATT